MQVTRPNPPPLADLNMDGVVNSTDSGLWSDLLYSTSNASVYADSDLDFDGLDDWNSGGADGDLFYESYNANTGLSGVGRVSSPGVGNRVGYAGYQWDQTISANHVRYRVYLPDIGRWTRRDPLGYVDGKSLYQYVQCQSIATNDASGCFDIKWKGTWTPREQRRIRDLMTRIRERIAFLLQRLDRLMAGLSECERRILKSDLAALEQRLTMIAACIDSTTIEWNLHQSAFNPEKEALTSPGQYLRPRRPISLLGYGRCATYVPADTDLNIHTLQNFWKLSDDGQARLLFHELVHVAEGYLGSPDRDNKGGTDDAHNIDDLLLDSTQLAKIHWMASRLRDAARACSKQPVDK